MAKTAAPITSDPADQAHLAPGSNAKREGARRKGFRIRALKLGVQGKVIIVFAVMGTLLAFGVGAAAYFLSYSQESDHYTGIALSSAKMAASLVDGNRIDRYLKDGADDSYYTSYEALKKVKSSYGLIYLYIIRPGDVGVDGVYVFDTYTVGNNPTLISGLGTPAGKDDMDDMMRETYQGVKNISHTAVNKTPEYGYLASAYAPVYTSDGSITAVAGADVPMNLILKDVYRQTIQVTATALGILTLSLLIILFFINRRVLKPVVRLSRHMESFAAGGGELSEFELTRFSTDDELQTMSESFNRMVSELRHSMKDLAVATADHERIATELNVATEIQASMLPCIFPPFPDREEFDLYATMLPAKEVGGDFYDFFLLDDDTLAVVIADVSGKGIPAALFMVIAKTLIKNNAQLGKSPKEVFDIVNNLLCENNEAGMFVTAFMGYLTISSGRFTYVNAGHNPPLLRTGKGFHRLKTTPGFVLAGLEDTRYEQYEVTLHAGDELFLYTDGVTEVANKEGTFFGSLRLFEMLDRGIALPFSELIPAIRQEIDLFTEGAEQADDITMLALCYKGEETG